MFWLRLVGLILPSCYSFLKLGYCKGGRFDARRKGAQPGKREDGKTWSQGPWPRFIKANCLWHFEGFARLAGAIGNEGTGRVFRNKGNYQLDRSIRSIPEHHSVVVEGEIQGIQKVMTPFWVPCSFSTKSSLPFFPGGLRPPSFPPPPPPPFSSSFFLLLFLFLPLVFLLDFSDCG